jgi:hypothetical protein
VDKRTLGWTFELAARSHGPVPDPFHAWRGWRVDDDGETVHLKSLGYDGMIDIDRFMVALSVEKEVAKHIRKRTLLKVSRSRHESRGKVWSASCNTVVCSIQYLIALEWHLPVQS